MFDFGGPFFGWLVALGVVVLGIAITIGVMRQRRETPTEHAVGERATERLYEAPEPTDPDRK